MPPDNHIKRAIEMAEGRVEGGEEAARLLKPNSSTLRTKMRKLKIPFGICADASDIY